MSELTELYIAMMIRAFGLSLIGIFIPVYLYQLGFDIPAIASYYMVLYGTRIITDGLAAKVIGYYGPKHVMIISQIFLIISLGLFLSLESFAWNLSMIAFIDAISAGMFYTAYHIEFSKIQSSEHAGHQLGSMYKYAKLSGAAGPLIGGALASLFSLQLTIALAMAIILASGIPLAMSPETIRLKQHITWKGFPWRKVSSDIMSNIGLGPDQMSTLFIWPLYISIFIFSDNVYLSVGLITSLGLFASFFAATKFGQLIDKGRGARLLNAGVMGSSISHLARLLITNPLVAYFYNVVADSISISVRMPYTKGLYGEASSYEGYRNAYLAAILVSSNVVRCLVFTLLYFLASIYSDELALKSIFVVAAFSVWTARFNTFRRLR